MAALGAIPLAALIATGGFLLLPTAGQGGTAYPGQWAAYSNSDRTWFKGVKSPRGVPCCDIADGHVTSWRHGQADDDYSGYEIPIAVMPEAPLCDLDDVDCQAGDAPKTEILWVRVPKTAVIENAHKPDDIEESVVWYVKQRNRDYFIRCFVPGDGA